jgi:hypothetical protein
MATGAGGDTQGPHGTARGIVPRPLTHRFPIGSGESGSADTMITVGSGVWVKSGLRVARAVWSSSRG